MKSGISHLLVFAFLVSLPAQAAMEQAFSIIDLSQNFTATFNRWQRTYQETNDSFQADDDKGICTYRGGAVMPLFPDDLNHVVAHLRVCRPTPQERALVYNREMTPEQKKKRDDLICQCMKSPQSNEGLAQRQERREGQRERATKNLSQQVRDESAAGEARKAFGIGMGSAVTAMNFAGSDAEAQKLAGVYIPSGTSLKPNDVKALNGILDPSTLSDDNCVPPREFIFSSQFPEEPLFYDELNKDFRPQDWDFSALAARLEKYSDINSIKANDEDSRAMVKMGFLIRNPAFKAIFMAQGAGAEDKKRDLYNLIKTSMPRQKCSPLNIGLDLMPCDKDENWAKAVPDYKAKMSEFLRQPNVNNLTQDGLKRGSQLTWMATGAEPTSDLLGSKPDEADNDTWKAFCDFRDSNEPRVKNEILAKVESEYSIDYADVSKNPKYVEMNRLYCRVPRRNAQQETKPFAEYRQQNCGRTVSQRECLANFVQAYPYSSQPIRNMFMNINELLKKPDIIVQVGSNAGSNIAAISRSPEARREAFTYLEKLPSAVGNGIGSAISGVASSVGRAISSITDSSSSNASNNQVANPFNQPESYFVPNLPPQVSAADAKQVQDLGSQAQDSQNRVNSVKEEVSSLINQINGTRASSTSDDDPRMKDLSARLRQMEAQLAKAESDANETRTRYEEALARARGNNSDDSSGVASVRNQQRSNVTNDNGQSDQSVKPIAQGGTTSGAPVLPTTGGASLGSGSFNSGGAIRGGQVSSANSALLSKYNSQLPAPESDGAIILNAKGDGVSSNAPKADSIVPVQVSADDYNAIANDKNQILSRFRDQVQAANGNTVMVEIIDGNRTMNILISKNGSQLSVVTGSNQPVVDRRPASREFELRNLQQELTAPAAR